MSRIEIQRAEKKWCFVEAEVIGKFAVHQTPNHAGWTLTHLPTKKTIRQHILHAESAAVLARELSKFDVWDFIEPSTPKAWSDEFMSTILQRIRWVLRDDKLGRYIPPKYARRTPETGASQ